LAARAAEDDRDFADTRLRQQVTTSDLAQIGVECARAALVQAIGCARIVVRVDSETNVEAGLPEPLR
jgi:hypothetical protein